MATLKLTIFKAKKRIFYPVLDISAYPLRILKFLIFMATLKLTIFKAKVLKEGRHKTRVAVCHKHETSYIIPEVY